VTLEIGLLIALTVACVVLFSFEKISPDVTALMLVLALVFTGLSCGSPPCRSPPASSR
jgi:hypothetical protein